MKTFKLHLIRHGLTQGNIDGVYVGGGLDVPLCDEGAAALRAMRLRYRYPTGGVLFSSPMKRALQSAELLYPEMKEKIMMEELRENRFGEFEGRRVAELMRDERFTQWLDPKSTFVPKGGESGEHFAARTAAALYAMLEYQAKNDISAAVCVTHGGVIMSMLSQMAVQKKPYAEWMADNGAGFTVQTSAAMLTRDHMVEAVEIVPYGYMDDVK